jgi:uncharacterized Zn finger protein (UPF0148 family)
MTIQFHCSHCKSALCIDRQHVGKQVRCPQCQTLNLVKESMQFSENNPDQNEPTGSPKGLYSESFQPAPATPSRKLQPHQGGMIIGMVMTCLFLLSVFGWILMGMVFAII